MKNIIKRILIGVSIGVLLMIIKGNFLLIVNAETTNSNNIIYQVPDTWPMYNQNNFYYSNFMTDNDALNNPISMQANWRYLMVGPYYDDLNYIYNTGSTGNGPLPSPLTYYGKYCPTGVSCTDKLFPPTSKAYVSTSWVTIDSNYWLDTNSNMYKSNFEIESVSTYEMVIELQKTNNMQWYIAPDLMENTAYNKVFIMQVDNEGNKTTISNANIIYDRVVWSSPMQIGEGASPNLAYIRVRFHLDNIVEPTSPTNKYYLTGMEFTAGNTHYGDGNSCTGCDTKYFVSNQSDTDGTFKVKSFNIIKNGNIQIVGEGNDIPGAVPNLDSTTQADLTIKDNKRTCSSTDIVCHLQNIIDYLYDITRRIGNFFTNLISNIIHIFIPNENDWSDLQTYVNALSKQLHTHLGIVVYPFELMAYIFNKYIDLLTNTNYNHVLTLPQLKEPFSNNTIWAGGTLDLGAIFSTGAIGTLHEIYMSFVSVYIILMFVDFLIKSFHDFINGTLTFKTKVGGN